MASIRARRRRDGTPYWQVLYRDAGKQRSLMFRGEHGEAAAGHARDLFTTCGSDRALEILNVDRPIANRLTVEQYLRAHIDQLTGVEQKTLDEYGRFVRRDIAPTIGAIPLAELTGDHIADWVKHLQATGGRGGAGQSPKTIANKHGFLSGALATAVPYLISANPAAGRRLPRGGGDDHEMVVLSRDAYAALQAAMSEPWRPFIEFLVASGCRFGEATALKPGDVDRDAGTVHIRRAWKHSTHGWRLGPPKSRRSKRDITVAKTVLDKLDYSGEWLFCGRDGPNWRQPGDRPIRIQGFHRRVWQPAVIRTGLLPRPRVHDLRHTCASWMIQSGIPMVVVSRHLGHENISTTIDLYSHIDRVSAQAAADTIGDILNPEQEQ